MKFNKKQLMLGLLFVALASRMHAADDNALLAQAREFAQQLQMHCNLTGSSIVSRLVDSIEHLMPFVGQVEVQTEQIASLEEQVAQASRQREAIMHLLGGVQMPVVAPVVPTAYVSEESLEHAESSSSSSQSTLIDDIPEAVFALPGEASIARPNKRTERPESTLALSPPTSRRPWVGRSAPMSTASSSMQLMRCSNLVQMEERAKNRAPHVCEVCDKQFTTAQSLRKHDESQVHQNNKRLKDLLQQGRRQ